MKLAIAIIMLIGITFLTACTTTVDNAMKDSADNNMMDNSDHNNVMVDNSNDAMMNNSDDNMMEDANNSMMEETGDNMMENTNDSMMQDNNMMTYQGEELSSGKTKYLVFTQADYKTALAENKVILLNFYANWCPTCKAEQPKVIAAFNELELSNVVGFRVNYKDTDTDSYEEELAREFGISYQHTKVILKKGERVLKSPESWDKQRYIDEINKIALA